MEALTRSEKNDEKEGLHEIKIQIQTHGTQTNLHCPRPRPQQQPQNFSAALVSASIFNPVSAPSRLTHVWFPTLALVSHSLRSCISRFLAAPCPILTSQRVSLTLIPLVLPSLYRPSSSLTASSALPRFSPLLAPSALIALPPSPSRLQTLTSSLVPLFSLSLAIPPFSRPSCPVCPSVHPSPPLAPQNHKYWHHLNLQARRGRARTQGRGEESKGSRVCVHVEDGDADGAPREPPSQLLASACGS
ncbi:hypothetical protein DFH07DRAFT_964284 [Mycena maculata]|uniref:Uncharacterized protein n=1 Tax=Mycena maculata TaxID=230809 RepID=A0AAD7N2S5_9AGAR|nr:hypothetical protein DFH07DRAFT_964284 [Mycena maculata]